MPRAEDQDSAVETAAFESQCTPAAQPTRSLGRDKRQIVINVGSNAAVMVVKVIIGLAVAPLIVRGLGDTQYGIWIFVSSITAYLALGDLGIKSAVIRFVARYDGLADTTGINRVLNTSLAILSSVAAVVLTVTFVAANFWHLPKSIPSALVVDTRLFLVLSGIQVAMLLPLSVPHAMLAGLGRFPLRNGISVISLVFRNALLVAVICSGGGLVTVGLVLLAACGADYVMCMWAARRCLPGMAFGLRYVDRAMLRSIGGYGFHVFVGDIAFMVIGQSAPLIIGICLASVDCNTYYSLGASLKDYASSILGMLMLVLVPAVGKWHATGDHAAIRTLLIEAARYALYFTVPIELGLLMFGRSFLWLWMGPHYADAGYAALAILSLPLALSAVSMVASRILLGLGVVRSLAAIAIAQAVLTIVLGAGLALRGGIEGVAWGVTLALMPAAVVTIALACRHVGLGLIAGAWQVSWAPLLASAPAALTWLALKQWVPIDTWARFVGIGALGMVPFALILLFVERDVRHIATAVARKAAATVMAACRMPRNWLGVKP